MATRRVKIIAAVALLCLLATAVVFVYRSEDRVPIESELVKYPEFAPFLVGRKDFRGIRFNVDTNVYSFAFTTNAESADAFFAGVSRALVGTDWRNAESHGLRHTYVRQSSRTTSAMGTERVTLTFNPETKEVIFVREDIS